MSAGSRRRRPAAPWSRGICVEARRRAVLVVDGELDNAVAAAGLESHLRECALCARFAAEVAATAELVQQAPLERFSVDPNRLVRLRLRRRISRLLPATAAATVAVTVGVLGAPLVTSGPQDGSWPASTRRAPTTPFKLPIGQRSAATDFVSV